MSQLTPRINPGKRAVLAGRTGSGKSTLAKWLMLQSGGHWIIINPKWTAAFDDLPNANKIIGIKLKDISKSVFSNGKYSFTIINPKADETTPDTLDLLVMWLHQNFTHVGVYVDELYSIHTNGRAGAGLVGLLTRGRELGQTFLGATQRPAFVSNFVFSEAEYICGMSLNLKKDRERMVEYTGSPHFAGKLPAFEWLWYDVNADTVSKWGAVPY
jgi:energy-coupling factor transporter ATP-binding protein EcfA2